MKKLLFIINPKAGVKKNKHFVDDALEIFERAGYKVGVKYTKKRADGTRIARDYGAKADLIAVSYTHLVSSLHLPIQKAKKLR